MAAIQRARDEFSLEVKDLLARRVGVQCANPNCRRPTSGPQKAEEKSVNVGVAAHITAASPGGPRYDASLTPEKRGSADNGIWLCQNCAKLVDNDERRYPVDLLRDWKRVSEEAALLDIEHPHASGPVRVSDEDIVRFFAQCFDRPAFQDPFEQEGSMEAFDRAIEDTITALNTGCLRARDGGVLAQSHGKAFLRRDEWRQRMDAVVDLLRAIRSRYRLGKQLGLIQVGGERDRREWHCINDRQLADWMDSTRAQLLQLFSEVAKEAGVAAPVFPPHRMRW